MTKLEGMEQEADFQAMLSRERRIRHEIDFRLSPASAVENIQRILAENQ